MTRDFREDRTRRLPAHLRVGRPGAATEARRSTPDTGRTAPDSQVSP
ncbi:MAG: hypothetical protein QOI42_1881 [Frankiaceae bacterium]|nr:hypothetical protein [Frankiaceae bacterium]